MRDLEDIETSGLRQMKGIFFLPRMFNIRIGSHAIKQCIFKGPKLGRKIFNFLASIPLDLAGIIDTHILNVIINLLVLQGGLMKPYMPFFS